MECGDCEIHKPHKTSLCLPSALRLSVEARLPNRRLEGVQGTNWHQLHTCFTFLPSSTCLQANHKAVSICLQETIVIWSRVWTICFCIHIVISVRRVRHVGWSCSISFLQKCSLQECDPWGTTPVVNKCDKPGVSSDPLWSGSDDFLMFFCFF